RATGAVKVTSLCLPGSAEQKCCANGWPMADKNVRPTRVGITIERCTSWRIRWLAMSGNMICCGREIVWALRFPAGWIRLRCSDYSLNCGPNLDLSFLLFISTTD